MAIAGLGVIGAFFGALRTQEPAPSERSVWDGVYTEEQAKRGEALYEKQCSACHGEIGRAHV